MGYLKSQEMCVCVRVYVCVEDGGGGGGIGEAVHGGGVQGFAQEFMICSRVMWIGKCGVYACVGVCRQKQSFC